MMTQAESLHLFFLLYLAETWKRVPGWPAYEVSNWGRAKSYWKRDWSSGELQMVIGSEGRLLKPCLEPVKGHWHYTLGAGEKGSGKRQTTFAVGKLVLMAFDSVPEPGEMVRHVHDPTPSNNFRWNLAWGTASDNMRDKSLHGNARSPLRPADIPEIRRQLAEGITQGELGERYGVGGPTICHINTKKRWGHIPG